VSDSLPHPLEPNILHERIFNFYDDNKDGLIGFEEFVGALAYLLQPAKRKSMRKVFEGYDFDGDGYVSRRDFIRMLSAKYALHKIMILENISVSDAIYRQHGRSDDIARSSRPLSSAFTEADVPQEETRRPFNKPADKFGEPQTVDLGLYSDIILPDGETEMDNTFWNAVFDQYGRPQRLTELHPRFNESLEARLEVRSHYTASEALPVGEDVAADQGQYLVPTDTRDTRGSHPSGVPLAERLRQDLEDSRNNNGSESGSKLDSIERYLDRGKAFEVPAKEVGFGKEVLFQVVQDGFNEMLDSLFRELEEEAERVRRSLGDRTRYRDQINNYKAGIKSESEQLEQLKKARAALAEEIGAADDPLIAIATSPNARGSRLRKPSEPNNATATQSTAIPNARRLSPPNGTSRSDESRSLLSPASLTPTAETHGPEVTSQELSTYIAQQPLQPTDEASLETMERSIRERPLEELLQLSGYAIESEPQDGAAESVSNAATDGVSSFSLSMDDHDATDPTLPQNRPNASTDGSEQQGQQTVHEDSSVQEAPSPSGSSEPSLFSDECPMEEEDDPYAARFQPQPALFGLEGRPLVPSNAGTQSSIDIDNSSEHQEKTLSIQQLKAYWELDEVEDKIIVRGGPARLNLEEFEAIVQYDMRHGSGLLKGIVESWLEWAAL